MSIDGRDELLWLFRGRLSAAPSPMPVPGRLAGPTAGGSRTASLVSLLDSASRVPVLLAVSAALETGGSTVDRAELVGDSARKSSGSLPEAGALACG